MKDLSGIFFCILLTTESFMIGCGEISSSYVREFSSGVGDTDTDADIDTNADRDADAVTDAGCGGNDVGYDPKNALCWQDPPSDTLVNWYIAAGVEHPTDNPADGGVEDYCSTLGSGWRLPTIGELRSLFRSGIDTECSRLEWDLAWTKVPDGYCGVRDGCLDFECLVAYSPCNTSTCGSLGGPGSEGCYWDEALIGECTRYWSSSEYADVPGNAWCIDFHSGRILPNDMDDINYVRCVRDGP